MAGDRQHFTGRHLLNARLTGAGSGKITRHHEIAIEGAPVVYLPGDALGVQPHNDQALVDGIIRALGATGDEAVPDLDGSMVPLARASPRPTTSTRRAGGCSNYSPRAARRLCCRSSKKARRVAEALSQRLERGARRPRSAARPPRDSRDPGEFVETLRKTLPRLYSVASSLKAHPRQVHLLVVSVRFTIRERERVGICSTWLADRWPIGSTPPSMYMQNQQKHFAMPADPSTPMIMIGPGTGLAPFRAFIEERRVLGSSGRNWLFFGEQRRKTDFFYESELCQYTRDGFLRLDLAFSRDQASKLYVQHRMHEQARDLWAWIEDGAEIFVCGDKERMAADVDHELHAIAESVGGKTPDEAQEYVEALKTSKRYKRDVY